MGDVMTDLQGRRAIIMGMDSEGSYQKILAKVPLAENEPLFYCIKFAYQRACNL